MSIALTAWREEGLKEAIHLSISAGTPSTTAPSPLPLEGTIASQIASSARLSTPLRWRSEGGLPV